MAMERGYGAIPMGATRERLEGTMVHVERILIVGGGIAGLSLATALHRQGFAAELVERSPAWPAIGATRCCASAITRSSQRRKVMLIPWA
jgi:heterodisulfide reductase subunit A-like polyferredoxin